MSMKIITGSTGTTHVTSNNDGEFNQGIFGVDSVVLTIGEKFAATLVDNNTITIADGDLIMQGRHALIEPGTTETISIDTGSVGNNRNDLIVAQYELNTSTGHESMTLEVLKGTETSGTAQDPTYETGDIRTGDTLVQLPLYRVVIEGVTITAVEKLFTEIDPITDLIDDIREDISGLNSSLNGLKLVALTQAEYNALGTKDAHTLYIVTA